MNDASTINRNAAEPATAPVPAQSVRPATPADLKLVHARLMEAIGTSPFYGEEFRAYEKARLSPSYLRNLISIDPRHILVLQQHGGTIGLMMSAPALGTLWLDWSYIFPEFQGHTNAMAYLRSFIENWENDRFHKIATYAKPDNRVAIALMRRFKFTHVATLENHIFGEDYMLFEHPLTRGTERYDHGLGLSLAQRLGNRLLAIFGH